jgi:AcrR family transcriptional regulator
MDHQQRSPALAGARRTPVQKRSRERVDRILAAASNLIGAKGSQPVTMSEIARDANMSMSALYQYFPDKNAIIHALAERYRALSRRFLEAALRDVRSMGDLKEALTKLLEQYYESFSNDPAMRDLWLGLQGSRELMLAEIAANRDLSELLAQKMRQFLSRNAAGSADATALLLWELGETTLRLALTVDAKEGRRLIDIYQQAIVDMLDRLHPE